jgi:hypothetical protein
MRLRRRRRRQIGGFLGFMLSLVMIAGLGFVLALRTPPPSTRFESSPQPAQPPPPTLQELAQSADMRVATSVIEYNVERLRQDWNMLVPLDKHALCAAGKAIRSAMHTYRNTVADLNQVQRAIYDITEPSGRCR